MDSHRIRVVDEYSVIAIVSCKIIDLSQYSIVSVQALPMENRNRRAIATLAMDHRRDDDREFVPQITNN